MNVSKPIGIVGLGLMGSALAQRLLDAGYAVLGFDIDREQRAALENIGGTFAGSLPDIAQCCTSIFLAVFNTEQVEDSRRARPPSSCRPELGQAYPLYKHL